MYTCDISNIDVNIPVPADCTCTVQVSTLRNYTICTCMYFIFTHIDMQERTTIDMCVALTFRNWIGHFHSSFIKKWSGCKCEEVLQAEAHEDVHSTATDVAIHCQREVEPKGSGDSQKDNEKHLQFSLQSNK